MIYLYTFTLAFFLYIFKHAVWSAGMWHAALPDLALLLLVTLVASQMRLRGVAAGLCVGLAFDLLSSQWFGLQMLSLSLTGLFLDWLQVRIYLDKIITFFSAVLAGLLIRGFFASLLIYVGSPEVELAALGNYYLHTSLYTILVAGLLYVFWRLFQLLWKTLETE